MSWSTIPAPRSAVYLHCFLVWALFYLFVFRLSAGWVRVRVGQFPPHLPLHVQCVPRTALCGFCYCLITSFSFHLSPHYFSALVIAVVTFLPRLPLVLIILLVLLFYLWFLSFSSLLFTLGFTK